MMIPETSKLETNLLSGTGVDLYITYGISQLTKRAQGSMALDLTDLMTKDNFSDEECFRCDMAKADHVDVENHMLCRQNWINTRIADQCRYV